MTYYGKNKDGYLLQNKLNFQGLSIDIENSRGSQRHWFDPASGEKGSTTMVYDYGYVRSTSGVDGDEVDVYVGDDVGSNKVYVITQMKNPNFNEVDEQKVMLGFSSEVQAVYAYMLHYNDVRFFGGVKEISIDEFKEKLSSQGGNLIKSLLNKSNNSARLHSDSYFNSTKGVTLSTSNKNEAIDILNKISTKASVENENLNKALTAQAVIGIFRNAESPEFKAASANEKPAIGTDKQMDSSGTPVVPVRRINNLPSIWSMSPAEVLETKTSYKTGGSLDQTAKEFHRR